MLTPYLCGIWLADAQLNGANLEPWDQFWKIVTFDAWQDANHGWLHWHGLHGED